MPFILPLGQAHGDYAWRVGPKASRLSALQTAAYPAPAGFALSTDAMEHHICHNGLEQRVVSAQKAFDEGPAEAINTVAADLRQAINDASLPPDLEAELHAALQSLGPAVAVRSSSTFEDRADLSFAGQHDSRLNRRGFDECATALKQVWASLWSDRALAYLRALGISTTQLKMGVLVQEMVAATAAGVCFTVHPLSGDYNQIQVSAGAGLGEATVSGEVTPDEITVDRQSRQILSYAEGSETTRSLTETQALAVAAMALEIEEHLGGDPQDIEWALDGDTLHLLQARPMVMAAAGTWESPIPGAKWKRNWRLGEWLPEAVTPLFGSWVLPKLVAAREQFGTGRLGWEHQPTFSMPHPWYCLVNGYFFTRQDFPGWGDDNNAPPDETPEAKEKRQRVERQTQRQKAIDFRRTWHNQLIPAYLEHFETHRRLDLTTCPAPRLLQLIEHLAEEAGEIWYVIAPIGYGFEEMGFKPRYEELIATTDRPHYTELLSGYPSRIIDGQEALHQLAGRIAADPQARAALDTIEAKEGLDPSALPAWLQQALSDYAADYGHQLKSMDFYFSTAGEDLAQTLVALQALVRHTGRAPESSRQKKAEARDQAVAAVLAQLDPDGPDHEELASLIEYYQTNASIREDANFYLQLGWPLMRAALDQLGQRLTAAQILGAKDELFFLERDELYGAVAALEANQAPQALQPQALSRRQTWQRQRSLEAPEALPVQNEAVDDADEKTGYIDDKDGRRFIARAASPGLYRGRVRLVGRQGGAQRIEAGEVLVTYTASPALTPLLLVAGALVVDIGGGASHSSLVARELGLPAVVNTVNGSRILQDGMQVEVDGTRGTVRILD
jgi:rifampicin phosphotransferase